MLSVNYGRKQLEQASAFFRSEGGLRSRVFRGGAWLGAGSVVEQTFRFGRNMLLTRVLAPEAFGTMAIVLSTSSILQSLTEVGVKEALIQSPRGTEEGHVAAAWWLALGRAALFYFVLFFLSPFIGSFYHLPQLTGLLRVAAIGLLFEGAISTKAYVAIKEMKFSRWAFVNHGGGIAGVLTTVILSFFIRDVWALVIGYCAESAFRCLLSFIFCPYFPPLSWNREAIGELLRFSKGVFGLPVLNLIFSRADIFILAKMYSSADLGFYAMAIYLVQTPVSFAMNLLGQTLMPTFAQIRDDKARTNKILLQVTAAIFLVGMPVLVFLIFSAHSLLTIVYGQRYSVASAALIVAAGVALLNLANAQITTVFYAKGFPFLHRRSVAFMAIVMMALVYPLAKRYGLVGGQLACLISVVIGYLFQIERINKVTGLRLSNYRRSFLVPGAISLSAVGVCLLAKYLGGIFVPLPNVLLGIVGWFFAYCMACVLFLRSRTEFLSEYNSR